MKTAMIDLHHFTREEKDDLLRKFMDKNPQALMGITDLPYIQDLLKKAKFDTDKEISLHYDLKTLRWKYQQEES